MILGLYQKQKVISFLGIKIWKCFIYLWAFSWGILQKFDQPMSPILNSTNWSWERLVLANFQR